MSPKDFTRRDFVAGTTKAAFGAAIVPGFPTIVERHVLGGPGFISPSDKLDVAIVGFGGQGSVNAQALALSDNITAVCDVDMAFALNRARDKGKPDNAGKVKPEGARLNAQFDKAEKYADFREMLAKSKNIDAVMIATPDHLHAVVAKAAMDMGKHVYVQKPLTWSVHEARVLGHTARNNPKIITQMGNQGHSTDSARLVNEWIAAGIIGPVHEVHAWTNRPANYWPQFVPRPGETVAIPAPGTKSWTGNEWGQNEVNGVLARAMGRVKSPDDFRWDLYLGPVAEDIPYHPIYHPFNWRGWMDFGMGALGDMGAHLIDHPFWALGLGYPTSIEATSSPFGSMTIMADPTAPAGSPARRNRSRPVSYPLASTVHYEFPARGAQPAVKLNWFDGGLYPPRPDLLPDSVTLKSEGGVIYYGEKGILMHDTYGANPVIYPQSLHEQAKAVPQTMKRITGSHELNWSKAIKGDATASSPLEYAAQLTETMLLGIVALRTGQGRKLIYDGANMVVTNIPEANQYLSREYRAGWAI